MSTIDANALLRNLAKQIAPGQGTPARETAQNAAAPAKPKSVDAASLLALTQRVDQSMQAKTQLYQGINNAVVMVQTADGALSQTQGLLVQGRELVASGTAEDFAALTAKIDRLAQDTEIFGVKPLAASADGLLTSKATPFNLQASPADSQSLGLAAIDLSSPEGRAQASERIEQALITVGQYRDGHTQAINMLEQAINNTSESQRHLSAARMQILDADYAKATAELTRAEILQNSTITLLAQANTQGDNVSQLLGFKP